MNEKEATDQLLRLKTRRRRMTDQLRSRYSREGVGRARQQDGVECDPDDQRGEALWDLGEGRPEDGDDVARSVGARVAPDQVPERIADVVWDLVVALVRRLLSYTHGESPRFRASDRCERTGRARSGGTASWRELPAVPG